MGLGLVGAGLTAFGQFGASQMQANAAAYQAQVAAANAKLAARAETQTGQALETAVAQEGLRGRATIGKRVAMYGAAGIDPNTGSAAQVKAGMRFANMLNEQTVAARYGQAAAQQQAALYGDIAQEGLDRYAANTLPGLGALQAGGTLLSGIGKYGLPFA